MVNIGCGPVSSLVVQQDGGKIVRRDFGYENDYEGIIHARSFERVFPFTFDRAIYEQVTRRAL